MHNATVKTDELLLGLPANDSPFEVVVPPRYEGGDNFDLQDIVRISARLKFNERIQCAAEVVREAVSHGLYRRELVSCTDREVTLLEDGIARPILMFGSNSYLGLANHPHVAARIREVLDVGAIGLGSAPLLSGYTRWHRELEERLATLKGTQAALLYSTGYSANLGLVAGCCNGRSIVICDEYSHASFRDGLKLAKVRFHTFRHNDLDHLEQLLEQHASPKVDLFVGVEGLYSMDGDIAPLDAITRLCERHRATLMIDDAHATGVLGATGSGSTEHFGLKGGNAIVMGSFSKAFAGLGGFICGSRDLVDYLRFMSRPYMFSTSMPPPLVAQALGGLEVLAQEPQRVQRLRRNVALAHRRFAAAGIAVLGDAVSPIIAVPAPSRINVRTAGRHLHELGVFVNAIEYPAVPRDQQRFRVSIMASHTEADIERMVQAFEQVWAEAGQAAPAASQASTVREHSKVVDLAEAA